MLQYLSHNTLLPRQEKKAEKPKEAEEGETLTKDEETVGAKENVDDMETDEKEEEEKEKGADVSGESEVDAGEDGDEAVDEGGDDKETEQMDTS